MKYLALSGRTEPGAYLEINGAAISLDRSGAFRYQVENVKADPLIEAVAIDAAGNRTVLSRQIRYDTRVAHTRLEPYVGLIGEAAPGTVVTMTTDPSFRLKVDDSGIWRTILCTRKVSRRASRSN